MELELRGVSKSFDDQAAVDNVTFAIKKGELFSLLGPSGCGKTTTLKMIAGFIFPDFGEIYLNGQNITRSPVHRRGTAMVFQNYALFPHMSVFDNIAFGLKMQKVEKCDIEKRVKDVLTLIQLPGIEKKYPKELSGGMQQRVAIARAIVIHPEVLLLDEPLSNLDAKLREELRLELRELQQQIGITTVFVTHDISEAFSMSDRIAVIQNGRVMQIGSPVEIYEKPQNEFVGSFVGKYNRFPVQVREIRDDVAIVSGENGLKIKIKIYGTPLAVGEQVTVMVRPERIRLVDRPSGLSSNVFEARIARSYFLGTQNHYEVSLDDTVLTVETANNGTLFFSKGETCYLEWGIEDGIYFK